jgi:hypothetical protein
MRLKAMKAVGILSILVMVVIIGTASPALAATTSDVEAQLAAQVEINKLLKKRIRELESQVSSLRSGQLEAIARELDPPPEDLSDPDESAGALEEALLRRGSAVLPAGQKQIIPSIGWSHSGSGPFTSDSIVASIAGRVGLPGDWMLGVAVPYVVHSENFFGDNNGFGSVTATVWKQLIAQGPRNPSLVGSLSYSAPTGEHIFDKSVATGSAFHAVTGRLSAAKRIAPVAFFGDAFYSYAFEKHIGGKDRRPGDVFGFRAGASLAATPRISLQASVGIAFAHENWQDGSYLADTDRTIGTVNLGAGFIVSKGKYLSITGSFGVTDDASDFAIGASLPMRF